MLNLLKEGGGPMIFVVVFGLLTLVASALFAIRGDRHRLHFIKWMGGATAFSVLGGIFADLAAVGHHASERCPPDQFPLPCLLVGFAESMAPGIIGFTGLSLAAMLTAVGMSRTRGETA
jgi:hypothetical protein